MDIQTNALFLTDCLMLLERIASEQISLIYIDLPWSEKIKDVEFISRVLQQSRRILNEKGSIFFHLPSHIPPALRVIMDQVFGENNFRYQIIWPIKVWASDVSLRSRYEILLYYSKSNQPIFNPQFRSLSQKEIREAYPNSDEKGPYRLVEITAILHHPSERYEFMGYMPPSNRSWRYPKETLESWAREGKIVIKEGGSPKLKSYYSESSGVEIGDIWDDISNFIPGAERVSYSSQQPLALLKRIISMSTNEGDLILDPFCGSGTTMAAAHKLGRRWIGCDYSEEAHQICQHRLKRDLDLAVNKDYFTATQEQVLKETPTNNTYVPVFTGILGHLTRIGKPKFVAGQAAQIEENRVLEFKEIVSTEKPREMIKKVIDEYVVGFLNSDGGSIFFGIEDKHRLVKGVYLNDRDRDDIQKLLRDKLNKINPKVDPTTLKIEFHPVFNEDSKPITDLWVIEVFVPYTPSPLPYMTEGGRTFVKTEGMNKEMDAHQIIQWYQKRISIN